MSRHAGLSFLFFFTQFHLAQMVVNTSLMSKAQDDESRPIHLLRSSMPQIMEFVEQKLKAAATV
jgi:hypothetical protein